MIKNLLFDLDGTLTDPTIGIVNAIEYSLKKFGITNYNPEILKEFVGPPLKESYEKYFNITGDDFINIREFEREYYRTIGINENTIYENTYSTLETLYNKGYNLYIVTSKKEEFTNIVLDNFNIKKFFKFISASNDSLNITTKDEVIKYLIDKTNIDITKSIVIGDRIYDIEAAKNNNIKSIGVLYGAGSRNEIINSKPDYIINDIKEIIDIL